MVSLPEPRLNEVYPRVYGGTTGQTFHGSRRLTRGLSPRVRGNQWCSEWRGLNGTANGLSPRVRGNQLLKASLPVQTLYAVYPRVYGGTTSCSAVPRSLCRHAVYPRVYGGTGIPEGPLLPASQVYPRVYGGYQQKFVDTRRPRQVYPRVYGATDSRKGEDGAA